MGFLRRPVVGWVAAGVALVAAGAVLLVLRSDWSHARGQLEDAEERVVMLTGTIDQLGATASHLDEEVAGLSSGVSDCVGWFNQRVEENNRLAEELKNATLTSLSQLDPFVERFENVRDGTQADLVTCRNALG